MSFQRFIEIVASSLDVAGVLAIVVGVVTSTALFVTRARRAARTGDGDGAYRSYRSGIGRAILLSLEFLVAADMIRTVVIEPTFRGVGVLALIVLVRTFLSMTLELELDGRWPWQRQTDTARPRAAAPDA